MECSRISIFILLTLSFSGCANTQRRHAEKADIYFLCRVTGDTFKVQGEYADLVNKILNETPLILDKATFTPKAYFIKNGKHYALADSVLYLDTRTHWEVWNTKAFNDIHQKVMNHNAISKEEFERILSDSVMPPRITPPPK